MTISIVIPAYNEERYLPETLESIRCLDLKPDEILVIDASSTDKTREVAKKAGARVITVPKKTIGFSRQKGLLEARGEIVACTDADAILPGNWLSRIRTALMEEGYVGYFGGFRVSDGPWWYKFYINRIQPMYNKFLFLFTIPMATGQNMGFWKEQAINVGGFPVDFKMAEDIEIARRLMTAGKIRFTQDEYVTASGRRGKEGFGLLTRTFKVFFFYFLFRKANKIGFPAMR